MLTRAMIDGPLGPRFRVQSARDVIGFDASGWVVTHRRSGLAIWTGMIMTMSEAAERLDAYLAQVKR